MYVCEGEFFWGGGQKDRPTDRLIDYADFCVSWLSAFVWSFVKHSLCTYSGPEEMALIHH